MPPLSVTEGRWISMGDKAKFKIGDYAEASRKVEAEIQATRKQQRDLERYEKALRRMKRETARHKEYALRVSGKRGRARVVGRRVSREVAVAAKTKGVKGLHEAIGRKRFKSLKGFYQRVTA